MKKFMSQNKDSEDFCELTNVFVLFSFKTFSECLILYVCDKKTQKQIVIELHFSNISGKH